MDNFVFEFKEVFFEIEMLKVEKIKFGDVVENYVLVCKDLEKKLVDIIMEKEEILS